MSLDVKVGRDPKDHHGLLTSTDLPSSLDFRDIPSILRNVVTSELVEFASIFAFFCNRLPIKSNLFFGENSKFIVLALSLICAETSL